MGMGSAAESLYGVLREVQLEQFAEVLSRKLQLTKLEHLDDVRNADLFAVGMSLPAIRRFRAALKQRKKTPKAKSLKASGHASDCSYAKQNVASIGGPSEDFAPFLIAESEIRLLEKLGEGSFGLVRRAMWTPKTGRKTEVAAKVLHEDLQFNDDLRREVTFMQQHRHPHLVRLLGIVLSSPVIIVTEFCEGGCLLDRLRSSSLPRLLVSQLCDFARQLLSVMTYFEAMHFIHRDIAARNLLLKNNEKVVKLCDFGLAIQVKPGESCVASTVEKFPLAWCAPESLKSRRFSHASDVWSFAVCLWEMFTYGEEPWSDLSLLEMVEMMESGQRLSRFDSCPESVYQLLLHCWSYEPDRRPSFPALSRLFSELFLYIGNCRELQEDGEYLQMEPGDQIIVISGSAVSDYWYGQNVRTRKMGRFLRRSVDFSGRLTSCDISVPIPGSFLHTGHGDIRPNITWGYPDRIDEIYLRNPMTGFPQGALENFPQPALPLLLSTEHLSQCRKTQLASYSDVANQFLSSYEFRKTENDFSARSNFCSGVSDVAVVERVNPVDVAESMKAVEKPYYDAVPNDPDINRSDAAGQDSVATARSGFSHTVSGAERDEALRLHVLSDMNEKSTETVEGGATSTAILVHSVQRTAGSRPPGTRGYATALSGASTLMPPEQMRVSQKGDGRLVPGSSQTNELPFTNVFTAVPSSSSSFSENRCTYTLRGPAQIRRRRSMSAQHLPTYPTATEAACTSENEPLMRFSNNAPGRCYPTISPIYSDSGIEQFDPVTPTKCYTANLAMKARSPPQGDVSSAINQSILDAFDPLCSRTHRLKANIPHCAHGISTSQERKVRKLLELGLGSRSECVSALRRAGWELNTAAWNLSG